MSTQEGRNLAPTDWKHYWDTDNTYWDFGGANIALKELLEEKDFKLVDGTGLVPGCGRGYDVVYFAQQGHKAVGLDVSDTAIEKACEYTDYVQSCTKLNIKDKVGWIVGDFYKFEIPETKFQFAYDFTFFCTVFPTDRQQWADRYAEIISPGGQLITLMFPMVDMPIVPPPFTLSEEIYHEVLDKYFSLSYIDRDPARGHPKNSKVVMAVWTRKQPQPGKI